MLLWCCHMQTMSRLVSCCSQTKIILFICFNYFCQVTAVSLEEGAVWLLLRSRKNDEKVALLLSYCLEWAAAMGSHGFVSWKDNPAWKLWLSRGCGRVMQEQLSPAATAWLWGVTCEEKLVLHGALKKTFLWVFFQAVTLFPCYSCKICVIHKLLVLCAVLMETCG